MSPNEEATSDVQTKVLQNTLTALSSTHDGTESDCCVICLDHISEACEAMPCSHRNFDFLCLASWLQQRSSCPLCKAEIKDIRYEFSTDGQKWQTFVVPKKGLEKAADVESSWATPDGGVRTTTTVIDSNLRRPRLGRDLHRRHHPDPYVSVNGTDPDTRAREALGRRRHIHRHQLYSLHVGSSPASGYRDQITPQMFESPTSDMASRARAWVRRELQVFEYLSTGTGGSVDEDHQNGSSSRSTKRPRRQTDNAEFVLEYIVAVLKTIDIQGSCGQAQELLKDFLGENTRLFLHELCNFLRSPYSVEGWDRFVQYDESRSLPSRSSSTRQAEGQPRSQAYQQYRPSRERLPRQAHRGGAGRAIKADRYRPD